MQRDLVEQARAGDLDAFTELARRSAPRLNGVASLVLRDPEQAKDAVQEALLTAWRDMGALRDPDAWDAWTRQLTVRVCYRLSRKEARRSLLERSVTVEPMSDRVEDSSGRVVDRDWLLTELRRLELDQRVVIALHYYLDLPMSDVARTLDIPFGTAASRLHRGLEALRSSMGDPVPTHGGLVVERSR